LGFDIAQDLEILNVLSIGIWSFDIVWDLAFGAWDLGFLQIKISPLEARTLLKSPPLK
jgi:hypothetical protein